MIAQSGESKFELWARWLSVLGGALLVLLGLALTNPPKQTDLITSGGWNWYLMWVLIQVLALSLAILFLIRREWRHLIFRERLNLVYSYFGIEWLLFATVYFKLYSDGEVSELFAGVNGLFLLAIIIAVTLALPITYFVFHSNQSNAPEEIFP